MKSVLKYLIIIILSLILGSSITLFILKKDNNISISYKSLVYINAIGDETISNGSGFVYKTFNNKDYILTNYHVIENYNDIYAYNINGKKSKAMILGYDEYTDLAILTVDNNLDLEAIKLGNSDKLNVGDPIYVLGTPIDLKYIGTLTKGIVSYVDREISINNTHGTSILNAIQVDAPINPGNSGGPLINSKGRVVGIVSIKEADINGIGFAIPINYAMKYVKKIENKDLKRPNLGGVMTNATNKELLKKSNINIDNKTGVVIIKLIDNYPLYNSKFQVGDVIVKINNTVTDNVKELQNEIYNHSIGDTIKISYYRNNEYYEENVKLNN